MGREQPTRAPVRGGGLDETRGQVVGRRLRTIPPVVLGLVLVTALLPLLLAVAVLVDLARWAVRRTPWMAVRLLLFLWVYLAAETAGLLALLTLWLAAGLGRREAWMAGWTWRFQQVWAGWQFGAVRGLFGLRLDVRGREALRPAPVLVLIRHASIVDNLLPSVIVAREARIHLRYVLKRELLSDPCLDVAGKRLPNAFVRRGTGAEAERALIRRLATGLGPDDGLLIYPEGTRFTPERRAAGLAQVAERDPGRAARLERVEHLLPPKVGGVLAALDGAPEADVVLLAHHGLDGLRLISDIWAGRLVGRRIGVRLTRVPRTEIPEDREGRVRWLDAAWTDMDAWIAAGLRDGAAAAPAAS